MKIMVIGAVTIDKLIFAGRRAASPGGAGMYTALAVSAAGGRVRLLAPRPEPMPAILQPVARHLDWTGPVIAPEDVPRLEIEHFGGGRAALISADWGAQERLDPQYLPDELDFGLIHVAALGPAQRQLDFVAALKERPPARISIGTYAQVAYGQTEVVRRLFHAADLFFMNENEAAGLFGGRQHVPLRSGQIVFVTGGRDGAWVLTEYDRTHVPAAPAIELDPTGAGDTFCGAVLAGLSRGVQAVEAARQAVRLASQTIEGVGPQRLLDQIENRGDKNAKFSVL